MGKARRRIPVVPVAFGILFALIAVTALALLKWIVIPELSPGLGDACVGVNVVLMLVVRSIAFFSWGPVRGNWSVWPAFLTL